MDRALTPSPAHPSYIWHVRTTGASAPDLTAAELLAGTPDPVLVVDGQWRITQLNDAAAVLAGSRAESLRSQVVWDALPDASGSVLEREARRAAATRASVRVAARCGGREFTVRAFPLAAERFVLAFAAPAVAADAEPAVAATATDTAPDAFWQATVDALADRIAVLDPSGVVVATNAAWRDDRGRLGDVGSNHLDLPLDDETRELLGDVLAGRRASAEGERTLFGRRWRLRASAITGTGPRRVVVRHEDVTDRHRAQADARLRASILDEVDAAVVAASLDGDVTIWNRGAERLFGWSAQEALGRPLRELVPAEDRTVIATLQAELEATGRVEAETVAHDRHGRAFPLFARYSVLRDAAGRPRAQIAVALDVSDRHRQEQDLRAARDHLDAVTASMGDGLLVIDAEGRITLANHAACELLGHPDGSLNGRFAEELLHGRRGGLLGPGAESRDEDEFLRADGTLMAVSWSRSPLAASDGDHVVVFHDARERRAREQRLRREAEGLRWAERIRRALDRTSFVLAAQPIVDLASDRVVSHELLLRLCEADGRLIGPDRFLPAAEEHDLMPVVDGWVLSRAAEIVARGHAIHVNLSASSVGDERVTGALRAALARTGADPGRLVLEVTETTVLDEGDARDAVEGLRALGCRVALDDFGTGYSGLQRVTVAPIDAIKIDRSFVQGLLTDPAKDSVVRAMVSLAAGLDATVVAEGVEDQVTLDRLRALGITHAQGFWLGRPGELPALSAAYRGSGHGPP